MYRKVTHKRLPIFLLAVLALSVCTIPRAYAVSSIPEDTGDFVITDPSADAEVSFANDVLTINSGSMTISTNNQQTTQRIEVTGEVTLTLAGVNISATDGAAISVSDSQDVTLLLLDDSSNFLKGKDGDGGMNYGSAGIEKGENTTGKLSIGVPQNSEKTGKLEAQGGYAAPGIGGEPQKNVSNIEILDGNITAIGGFCGAGIGGGADGSGSFITIKGGDVVATGGQLAAGIGGGARGGNGTDITIEGGRVIASPGDYSFSLAKLLASGAGIGGGNGGNGTRITISGGEVTATGINGGAGIGGGGLGNGTEITISGGVITAIGGYLESKSELVAGAGIGSGALGSASGNKLSGNAVVLAVTGVDNTAGDPPIRKPQLEGFAESDMTSGIVFTGDGEYELVTPLPDDPQGNWVLKSTSWTKGTQYGGSLTISEDVTFPNDFIIAPTATLTVGKDETGKEATLSMVEGATLTIEGSLTNEGTVDIPTENLLCSGSGTITTLLSYNPEGGSLVANADSVYLIYQDANGVKKYEDLPEATNQGYDFDGWYTKASGQGVKLSESDNVLLNEHVLYANWVQPAPSPDPEPSEKSGWELDDTGWRYFVNNDAITGWKWIEDTYGAHWYFFGDDTYMVSSSWLYDQDAHSWYWVCSTGPMITSLWQWIDNEWYGFWWDGKMCTGWVWDTDWNAWFYCYQNGIMARNTWQDAYYLDWRGVWLH